MFKRKQKTQKVVVIQGQLIRIEEMDNDVIEVSMDSTSRRSL